MSLPAHLVAVPVLERLTGELEGVVLGIGATAAWVDLGGFVVAITTREVPLLPNAIALPAGPGALAPAAAGGRGTARLRPGRVALGSLQVTWDPTTPPSWDPTVGVPAATPAAMAARGSALLRALGSHSAPQGGTAEGVARRPAEGAVDDRGNPTRRSATLPHRGPQQPGAAEPAALVWEPGALVREPGALVREPDALVREPDALVREPDALVREPGALVREPGALVREPGALVRELAGIGLATAADPEGAGGLTLLLGAVRERDPEPAAAAVRALLGRGPGLTPEGDDLLAAVAGALAVLGPASSSPAPAGGRPRGPIGSGPPPEPARQPLLDEPTLDAMLAALAPIPGRTTALSATLLTLASERRLPEPAGRLLDLSSTGDAAWPAALARLERLGHGSGRAYAAGIAATACLLAAGVANR